MACCLLAAGLYAYLNKFQEKTRFDISDHVVRGLPEPDIAYGYHNIHTGTIIVGGMTCVACSTAVEDAVMDVPGVSACNVSVMEGLVTYVYDPVVFEKSHVKVKKAIEDAGFDAELLAQHQRQREDDQVQGLLKGYNQTMECGLYALVVYGCEKLCLLPVKSFRWFILVAAILAIACQYRHGRRFYKPTWASIKHRRAFTMDALVSLSTTVALILSLSFTVDYLKTGSKGILENISFELSTGTILVISTGKHFEDLSKLKLNSQMATLQNLLPRSTLLRRGSQIIHIPCSIIKENDLLVVMPGLKIPADGVILEGETYIDELPLTGEPMAVKKTVGDHVSAGTHNTTKSILIKATCELRSSVVSKLHSLASREQAPKDFRMKLITQFVCFFTPTIAVLSCLTFFYWYSVDPLYARLRALSVITIACPCALGLAIPATLTRGINVAAKKGLFVRGGGMNILMEILKNKKKATIMFDKTGTLTSREVVVSEFHFNKGWETSQLPLFWQLLYSAETGEEHPIAITLCTFAKKELESLGTDQQTLATLDFGRISGGVSCTVRDKDQAYHMKISNEGITTKKDLFFYVNGYEVASCNVKTSVREDTQETLRFLSESGFNIFVATGDKKEPTVTLCKSLGVKDYEFACTPERKHELVLQLKKRGPVIVIGDGMNDAGALIEADLAISLAAAHQLSVESAHVILMKDKLTSICELFRIAKQSEKISRINIWCCVLYNMIMIPLAMGILSTYGIWISPAWSTTLMSVSSGLVLSNSLWIE